MSESQTAPSQCGICFAKLVKHIRPEKPADLGDQFRELRNFATFCASKPCMHRERVKRGMPPLSAEQYATCDMVNDAAHLIKGASHER